MAFRKICAVAGLLVLALAGLARSAERIEFTSETLANGLRVIYAPLTQAPVVQVEVHYHVGSRDERPDRQGFAHMFEHMMFRGSRHVEPEQHMRLINMVGGYSNAFTSLDRTVYVNTIPSNQLELALYLEADRMASFKVSEQIYDVERRVVREEWGRRQNALYGTVFEDLSKLVYTVHPYRWTPIGDMNHLKAAKASELQAFFNRYYVPNNAALVIAGNIEPAAAKAMVAKFFGWIPRGGQIDRGIPQEPEQKQAVRRELPMRVPLARLMMAYKVPPYRSDEHYALGMLGTILGGGASSRLDNLLVNGENPLCVNVGAGDGAREDTGTFMITATVLAGRDPKLVEKLIHEAVTALVEKGVTAQELEKARVQERVGFVESRQTATSIASLLGYEALVGGDPGRVNTAMEKINAVSVDDVRAVAGKYLLPEKVTTLVVLPDPQAKDAAAATPPVAGENPPSDRPVASRAVQFPEGYPEKPPVADSRLSATFAKGTETRVNGVEVIIMPDHRLPYVAWHLTMRAGSHAEPAGKEGLGSITAELVRRGAAGMNVVQLNEDLESRGISLSVGDGGDYTRLAGSCLTEQVDHAMQRSRDILRSPTFPADEFDRLKTRTLSSLKVAEASPDTAASRELADALFGGSPLGKYATSRSVPKITLEDAKAWYGKVYRPSDAILIISGDVTLERGQELARKLVDGWEPGPLPKPDYALKAAPSSRRVILVDRPEGKQSMIRMALRAYTVSSDEKYAGRLASEILSSGINSRLGRYVRAEKGYAYSVYGRFAPGRHAGEFVAGTETGTATTADAIEAMFKVFNDMARDGVSEAELNEAKLRSVGRLVMEMQTIQQQAAQRVDGILNGYPADYYDRYPEHISAVSPAQVGQVVGKYVKDGQMTIVVVAPAEAVKEQLSRLGQVEVVPMPSRRQPTEEVREVRGN